MKIVVFALAGILLRADAYSVGCNGKLLPPNLASHSRTAPAKLSSPPPEMSPLKVLALSQAQAAAATIVETNRILDPTFCPDGTCKSDEAIASKRFLTPVFVQAKIARVRLWMAYRMLSFSELAVVERASLVLQLPRRQILTLAVVLYTVGVVLSSVLAGSSATLVTGEAKRLANRFLLRLLLFDVAFEWD